MSRAESGARKDLAGTCRGCGGQLDSTSSRVLMSPRSNVQTGDWRRLAKSMMACGGDNSIWNIPVGKRRRLAGDSQALQTRAHARIVHLPCSHSVGP